MGADHPPIELVEGAILAAREYHAEIIVIGQVSAIRSAADGRSVSLDGIQIVDTSDVITMEDKPMSVIREKNHSSMATGLRMLAHGEADAFVSAGNTGALITGSTLIVRRIRGIQRASIAAILPFSKPVLLIDAGANLTVTPEQLSQFAYLGSRFMKHTAGVEAPRVGLLNNGSEPEKGLPLQVAAYQALSSDDRIHFVGNIEPKTLPFDVCDVLVCDGFSGNLLLKSVEGLGKFFTNSMKQMFLGGKLAKLAGLMIRPRLRGFRHQFDASEHGGAPILGLAKPVIKAHGSSDARAIKNAIRQAIRFADSDFPKEAERYAASFLSSNNAASDAEEKQD